MMTKDQIVPVKYKHSVPKYLMVATLPCGISSQIPNVKNIQAVILLSLE